MQAGYHAKCPLLFPIFTKTGMCRHVFVEFHENPFRDSEIITCDIHGKANRHILQLLVANKTTCGLKESKINVLTPLVVTGNS
jgi:hypothetical protein